MKTLKVEKNNWITTITLNRPDVHNAFNEEMIAEMTQAFMNQQNDQKVRAVILKGEGESFCSGGDLHWMKSMVNYSEQENLKDSEQLFEMYQALYDIPVPVIGLVHGHAMGGGLGLIAGCDVVLAQSETKMCFSEVRLGLAPAVISHFVEKKIRPMDMSRYFLSAEIFTGQQAVAMGLVSEHGSLEAMKTQVEKLATKITQCGPVAVRSTKELIRNLKQSEDPKKMTSTLIAKLRVGSEGQEGLQAFFEKRKPSWVEVQS